MREHIGMPFRDALHLPALHPLAASVIACVHTFTWRPPITSLSWQPETSMNEIDCK